MKLILLLIAGTLLLLLAAGVTGVALLQKTYLFLDQHR